MIGSMANGACGVPGPGAAETARPAAAAAAPRSGPGPVRTPLGALQLTTRRIAQSPRPSWLGPDKIGMLREEASNHRHDIALSDLRSRWASRTPPGAVRPQPGWCSRLPLTPTLVTF